MMKNIFKFLLLLLTMTSISGVAQAPEKMSYQAVIRDNSDVLVKNSQVDLKINIRKSSPDGASVYEETHSVKTNINGLVSLEIGTGKITSGKFSDIDWSNGPFFIETLIDPEGHSNYTIKGVNEMLSVPFALHAKTADYFTGKFTADQLKGIQVYSDDDIDGNEKAFTNWDKDATDDFSGDFNDLINVPNLYTADEVDELLISIEKADGGIPQNLTLDKNTLSISGGNSISFANWDTDASDDFSGLYEDLQNKPELYSKTEIDNLINGIETAGGVPQNLTLDNNTLSISEGNSISFTNWDTDASDDFSGLYDDLQNKPELYSKTEIDNLINGIETAGGVPQNLTLDNNTLSISEGNSISFANWDTDASDDFDGNYSSLTGIPDIYTKSELYNRTEVDNIVSGIVGGAGSTPQNLSLDANELSISGGNTISFANWDTDASDDFSGLYEDLQNKPELYSKAEIDNLINGIETTGGIPQNLTLDNTMLSISGGNSISFANWDTDASDDFDGNYSSLTGTPDIYTKSQLYTRTEVDNIVSGIVGGTGSTPQNLTLDNNTLSISGGNTISFDNWDTNASDDFSGLYDDLQNKPDLYSKAEIDNLINGIETTGGTPQNLILENSTLSISGGNSISFENWDTDASDDFDGNYSSLTGAPKIYTQEEVDNIKAEILQDVQKNYVKKPTVISFTSSRNINSSDVGNTIACTSSATLTIGSGFSSMNVGDVINVEVHGTTFTVKGASGVVINGSSGGSTSIGNSKVYTGGLIRKTGNNSYIVL